MKKEKILVSKLGYLFYFQSGDNQLACYGSYFSGKEEVYLNDDLISSKRSFGFKSTHVIDIDGKQYVIVYKMVNPLSGKLTCSLLSGDKLILSQSQSLISGNNKSASNVLLRCFVVGFAAGVLGYIAGKYILAWV